jgi:Lon protease-like protein
VTAAASAPSPDAPGLLPLFPLQAVLFPGGLLQLKVFEARYLDLVSRCLRERSHFAVVCLNQGTEVRQPGSEPVRFESVGVLTQLLDVDAEQPGILRVRCLGGQRVELLRPRQRDDGLWLARPRPCADEATAPVPPALQASARALAQAIASLAQQGQHPIATPHRFDDAGWVANRWCELLPLPLSAKQRLMVLDEPLLRLKLVDDFLRSRGVLS